MKCHLAWEWNVLWMIFRGSVAPALDGKRMAIQLLSHEGAYKTDGSGNKSVTSSDTWIFVDDIKIVRTTSR